MEDMTMSIATRSAKMDIAPIDPAAVAAAEAAKARIQSAYIMAFKNSRDSDEARHRILQSCRRPAFAERVEYTKPVGNRKIKGPSIRFAEAALREWGNILSDIQIIYEDKEVRRSRILLVDLETNASFSKEIQIRKTVERRSKEGREVLGERTNTNGDKVYIVACTEDELHNKEAAQISKAIRNEGLRLIPSDIIDEAIEIARQTLRDRDAKDPAAAKKRLLDAFGELGISPKEIQKYIGHSTDTLSPKELEDLRGVYRAVKDGETSWSEFVKPPEAAEATVGKAEQLKKRLASRRKKEEKEIAAAVDKVETAAKNSDPEAEPPKKKRGRPKKAPQPETPEPEANKPVQEAPIATPAPPVDEDKAQAMADAEQDLFGNLKAGLDLVIDSCAEGIDATELADPLRQTWTRLDAIEAEKAVGAGALSRVASIKNFLQGAVMTLEEEDGAINAETASDIRLMLETARRFVAGGENGGGTQK